MASKREVAIIIKAIDKASRTLKGISDTGTRALKGIAIGAGAVTAAFAAMGAGYTLLLKKGIEYNNRMEGYAAVLTAVFQDEKKAIDEVRWAIELAAKTPFQIPDIVEAQKLLEAYGVSARKLLPFLADMAAATGKSILQAGEAVVGAQMGIWRRLREFAIRPEMLVPYGLEMTAQKQVKNIDSIVDAIIRYGTEVRHWAGQTDIIANTFRGLTSNLEDLWYGMLGILAQPAFEQIKAELRDVLAWGYKVREEGKIDEIFQGWGEAAGELIKVISGLVREVGPDLLKGIESSGKAATKWIQSWDTDKIKRIIRSLLDQGKALASLTLRVSELSIKHWKLIATFTGMLVITTVTAKIMAYIAAIGKAVIAIKAFIITHEAAILALTGPAGMIVALTALSTYLGIKYYRSLDKARQQTKELVDEALRLRDIKMGADFSTMESGWEKLNKGIEAQRRLIAGLRGEAGIYWAQMKDRMRAISGETENLDRSLVALSKLDIFPEARKFRDVQAQLLKASAQMDILKDKQEDLAGVMLKQMVKGVGEAAKAFYHKFIPVAIATTERLKAEDEEYAKTRQELTEKLMKYTLDEKSFEFKQAEAYYLALQNKYEEDAAMSALIAKAKAAHLAAIRAQQRKDVAKDIEDEVKAYKDAADAIMQLQERRVETAQRVASQEAAIFQRLASRGVNQLAASLQAMGKEREAEILQAQQQAQQMYQAAVGGSQQILDAKKGLLEDELDAMEEANKDAQAIARYQSQEILRIETEAQQRKASILLAIQKWLMGQMGIIRDADAKRDEDKAAERIERQREVEQAILQSEARMAQAAAQQADEEVAGIQRLIQAGAGIENMQASLEGAARRRYEAMEEMIQANTEMELSQLQTRLDAMKRAGDSEQEIARYSSQQRDLIYAQSNEEREAMARDTFNRITAAQIDRVEWELSVTDSLRREAWDKEQQRIRDMESTYMNYVNAALDISQQLFSQQEGGWLKALAMLTRFVTRTVAAYLRERAMEKLKEADQKQTQASWLRGHAQRLEGLAAEAGVYAAMAGAAAILGDPRQAAAALAYGKAAALAGGLAVKARGQAIAMEAQAKALQVEASALMTTATAVEAAGEVAATGFDLAADKVADMAEKEKERARDRERTLEAEFRLQQEILKLQGRTAEAERMAIEREAQQYREIGVDPALIDIWRRLSQGEVAPVQAAAPIIPAGGITGTGGRTITVYQTNTFAALLDTTDKEQLRELAVALRPFNDEIEALEGEA